MDGPRDGSASGLAMLNHIMGLICPSGRDPVTIQGLQVAHGLVYLVSLTEVMQKGTKHTKEVCIFFRDEVQKQMVYLPRMLREQGVEVPDIFSQMCASDNVGLTMRLDVGTTETALEKARDLKKGFVNDVLPNWRRLTSNGIGSGKSVIEPLTNLNSVLFGIDQRKRFLLLFLFFFVRPQN